MLKKGIKALTKWLNWKFLTKINGSMTYWPTAVLFKVSLILLCWELIMNTRSHIPNIFYGVRQRENT